MQTQDEGSSRPGQLLQGSHLPNLAAVAGYPQASQEQTGPLQASPDSQNVTAGQDAETVTQGNTKYSLSHI